MQLISNNVKQIVYAVFFYIGLVDRRLIKAQRSQIHEVICSQNARTNLLLYDEYFCPVFDFLLAPSLF